MSILQGFFVWPDRMLLIGRSRNDYNHHVRFHHNTIGTIIHQVVFFFRLHSRICDECIRNLVISPGSSVLSASLLSHLGVISCLASRR